MSILHVNQVKNRLLNDYCSYVDMSDFHGDDNSRLNSQLSRALAAYALVCNTNLPPMEACQYITDGYKDNGLDLVYFDKDSIILWIVQSKFVNNGHSGIDNGDVHKYVQGLKDLFDMKYDTFNTKVNALKDDIELAINNPQIRIKAIVAYTGTTLSSDNKLLLSNYQNEINDPSSMLEFLDFNLDKIHRALIHSLDGSPITTDICLSGWSSIEEPYKALYGLVNVETLASLANNYGANLFSDNIRFYLGSSEANKSMEETLLNAPDNFFYFNNGITILCDRFLKTAAGGSGHDYGTFHIENLKIVNGAQTVGTIGKYFAENNPETTPAKVLVKIIALSEAPQEFGNSITIANNTQNKIEKKDFISLDSVQERLRTELMLENINYHYKRSSQRPPSDSSNYSFEECTQALATKWSNVSYSVQAKREIGKLWENRNGAPYTDLFNNNLDPIYLIHVVKVYRYVTVKLASLISSLPDGREKRIYIYGNLFIIHIVMQRISMADFMNRSLDFDQYLLSIDSLIEIIILKSLQCANDLYQNCMIPQLYRNFTKCEEMKNRIISQF